MKSPLRSIIHVFICGLAVCTLASCGAVPDRQQTSRSAQRPQAAIPAEPSQELKSCLADLGATGARYSALPDRYYAPGCHTLGSVQLAGLAGDSGQIGLANIGPVTCETAKTLAGWARYGVDRAARYYLGSQVVRIDTMGSYSCRQVSGTTRLSAHSRAEAIDVSGLLLADGRRIIVTEDWEDGTRAEREFLRAIHRSACKRFATVLGPDYNADHRDHFHVEGQGPVFCR